MPARWRWPPAVEIGARSGAPTAQRANPPRRQITAVHFTGGTAPEPAVFAIDRLAVQRLPGPGRHLAARQGWVTTRFRKATVAALQPSR